MNQIYDVVIVGSGIAGLTAAIYLKDAGKKVLVLTKTEDISETNTYYAQGGIIAWKKGDTPASLQEDILQAGNYYNNLRAVEKFVNSGPRLVFDFLIEKLGIDFNRDTKGSYDYTEEAAHSQRRILHYQDHTGDKIEFSLIDFCQKNNIEIKNNYTAIDLITNNHHSTDTQELYRTRQVMGIYALNNKNREVEKILSKNVILATGGVGNIYQYTSNPAAATGDGMSMAYRAGADIINAEFVQFHPTSLFHKDIKRFLISESMRGEGAKLIDHDGNEFMHKYSKQKELAPRDVVARAIYTEMSNQGKEYMLLDIASHYQGEIPLKKRFSRIYETCKRGGIDITKEPIPIVPAAHYFCGGIKVDLQGRSSLKNLYAIGEISCTGMHGSNRLASSSLLEGLLWAKLAAEDIVSNPNDISQKRFKTIPKWKKPAFTEEFDPLLMQQDWKVIQMVMWNYAGIIRTSKGLMRATADLNYHYHRILKFYKTAKLSRDIIELRNAVVNASIIVNAAIHNRKSIGCHFIEN
jgi:L-aspartate oxidase